MMTLKLSNIAEEVRKLAELSLKSTGEVFTTISEIQATVGQTVTQIKESEMTIYKQEEATRQIQDSFTQINEQVNKELDEYKLL